MEIKESYSHLYGLEYLLVHQLSIWNEIQFIINNIDAENCKISKEKTKSRLGLFGTLEINKEFKYNLSNLGWKDSQISYWTCKDVSVIRKIIPLNPIEQKNEIERNGLEPIFCYNQINYVKNKVALEVQFGKKEFVTYDLFVKHLSFYGGNIIDVGIEIIPMKSLSSQMSSGVPYYESEIYNVIRHGRGIPTVPLVIIGISN